MVGGEVIVGLGDSMHKCHLFPAFEEANAVLDASLNTVRWVLLPSPYSDVESESEGESECQQQK